MNDWSPESWKTKAHAQEVKYEDTAALDAAVARLRELPPLVTSWEIEKLKGLLADAQLGKRFLLQGGDCAETVADCRSSVIASKLKILLQMSLVLVHGAHKPVIRVGRFAGQYAKPRSKATETKGDVELPSYFGDLVNRPEFTAQARRADPNLLLSGYQHAALTLNFIRSLSAGGFADVHHPEYWDLSFFKTAGVPEALREQYEQTARRLADALRFMEALGERTVEDLTRVDFFTSHEGLNLPYESAQTRTVPQWAGWYDLSTHFPWIGERTRALDGAHVEFFRGLKNPVGVKIGPQASPDEVVRLVETLNPTDEPGKMALITRMGSARVGTALPPIIEAVKRSGRRVLWISDPMHGNTVQTSSGFKTRNFDHVLHEVEQTFEMHDALGTNLGGVHFELTGEDVTECLGGAAGITEKDLDRNYASVCDPRLNYRQALEMSFRIARWMERRKNGR
ncbi:3-deoxy-7-phosphoheptulonate synthase class II [Pendulispora albinea]|uniref:Phospho-2-dehydro-3-deoxyheptonate aldolase n=1 Tax=Pendulispora albinea TaxID=2741071 RepID=A0ABZ2LPK7_9BACT